MGVKGSRHPSFFGATRLKKNTNLCKIRATSSSTWVAMCFCYQMYEHTQHIIIFAVIYARQRWRIPLWASCTGRTGRTGKVECDRYQNFMQAGFRFIAHIPYSYVMRKVGCALRFADFVFLRLWYLMSVYTHAMLYKNQHTYISLFRFF